MCLLRASADERAPDGDAAPPVDASADVLLCVAALPEELWKGPCIFRYL